MTNYSTTTPDTLHQHQIAIAELEARYKAINQAWIDSGIPSHVLQTPDWESGWRVLHEWLRLHDPRGKDLKAWEEIVARSRPRAKTTWSEEVHIFSHLHNTDASHGATHATIEEAGTKAILEWWRDRGRSTQKNESNRG